jgi:hypothetical protein
LLTAALDTGSAWLLKDDNDNVVDDAVINYASNLAQITYPLSIEANDSASFAIEMPENTTIESEYYTAEERVFGFRYVDND